MYHRFACPELQNLGHDLGELDRQLALLRRRRYQLLPLSELLERLDRGDPKLHECVAITVDDGYADFASAAPVFERYDCAATVFLTSGFVDQQLWLWWDRIERALFMLGNGSWSLPVGGTALPFKLASDEDRWAAYWSMVALFKSIPNADRLAALDALERFVDAPRPTPPP